MAATVYELRRAIVRLECSSCGAEANASCDCAKPYVPAAVRVAKLASERPELSNRAIAAELGVDEKTVRKARADQSAPDEVIGRDGKRYPSRIQAPEESDDGDEIPASPADHTAAFWLRQDAAKQFAALPYKGKVTREIVDAARAVASAWEALARQLEGEL
jgi:hypothetical protein